MNASLSASSALDPDEVLAAFAVVVRRTMIDAFQCTPEEALWLEVRLDDAFDVLGALPAAAVPAAVRHELATAASQQACDAVVAGTVGHTPKHARPGVVSAEMGDWVSAIMGQIRRTWDVPASVDLRLTADLSAVLADLGVGNETNPREQAYLPTEVVAVMARRPAAPTAVRGD